MLEKGISQSELARQTGIGRARICEYLSGKSTPRQDKLRKLYEALDIPSDGDTDYPTENMLKQDSEMEARPYVVEKSYKKRDFLHQFAQLNKDNQNIVLNIMDALLIKQEHEVSFSDLECPF